MMKFDLNKIKDRLNKEKEQQQSSKKQKDITKDILVKVDKGGYYNFRAVPYIHNQDYLENPFPARFYHFGLPGQSIFYCPQKNEGKKCAVCDFVWDQLKQAKGTPEAKEWNKLLAKKRIFIPGIIRGRENEGLKFFSLSTFEEKMGDHHKKLFKYFQDPKTFNFLDPENGYDLVLTYEDYTEEQQKKFFGAKVGFQELELDRDRTPISEDFEETWAKIEQTMPNVDSDIPKYEMKTYEDSLSVVQNWASEQEKRDKWSKKGKPIDQSKDTDGEVLEKETQIEEEDRPVEKVEVKNEITVSAADARKSKVNDALRRAAAASKKD